MSDSRDGARPNRLPHGTSKFAFFSEVLLVGAVVTGLSLLIVTVVPALTAGIAHLRRHLGGRADPLTRLWEDFRAACRRGWLVSLGAIGLGLLLAFNLSFAATGALPAGGVVRVVSALLGVALVLVVLRTAAAWEPGARWVPGVRTGARRTADDLGGSAMLAVAVGLCAMMVWMLLPLVIVVPGLLALAVVAVEHRDRDRRPAL